MNEPERVKRGPSIGRAILLAVAVLAVVGAGVLFFLLFGMYALIDWLRP